MDYIIKKGHDAVGNTFECVQGNAGELDINTVVTGVNVYDDGTAVKVEWTEAGTGRNRRLYGIYSATTDKVLYNPAVYTGDDITGTIYGYTGAADLIVDVYTLQSEISNAYYGSGHIPYYSNVDYTIKTPVIQGQITQLLGLTTYSTLGDVAANSMVFIDRCDNYAYAVYTDLDSVDSFRGKYKTSIEFKVSRK